ncbi:MFS transporter [Roseisolibacter sp. H3M3-2]|uniref:NTP/NDP exchange transporter n=1 Tax=Roseisolibacter sp. H3M3-2 TaxID=3031323 RepID=UPI0023DC5EBE|nr:MFS transporter [Roseisolibacter sp. H3M3-2]MDF1503237.1 MFS transporter [Roseisolibacter sp. H3M3-2]
MIASIRSGLGRLVNAREGEWTALLASFAYYFLTLSAYYILRPIRDDMGVRGGVENLAWLFTGTLVGMLLLHPVYTALVSRLPRRKFVPYINRFFILNLVAFFLLLRGVGDAQAVWVGRVFYIWVSVFNLFVVSVFWSLVTDVYRPEQSKRLFGFLAVGGTLGAMLGSTITSLLVKPLGALNLLLVSAVLLEVASQAARVLDGQEGKMAAAAREDAGAAAPAAVEQKRAEKIGGGVFEGVRHVLASPYLLGIALVMLFYTVSSTFVYFQQAELTKQVFGDDSGRRTAFFANVDLLVNAITLVGQLFVTSRVLRWLGVGAGLAFLPAISVVGFGVLAAAPSLAVLVGLQVARRAGNFMVHRPAREVLYTVLSRTDKYKSKNFNDTFVYRVGDQAGAWAYTAIGWLGLGFTGVSLVMVPFCLAWVFVALWLGRRYRAVQAAREERAAVAGAPVGAPAVA